MPIRFRVSLPGWLFAAVACLLLTGCVRLTLAWADLTPNGPGAYPPVLAAMGEAQAVTTPEQWHAERVPLLQQKLQQHVYGFLPDSSQTTVLERRVIDEQFLDGKAVLEEWELEATARFGGAPEESTRFHIVLAIPAVTDGPVPAILMQTFCANHNTIPAEGITQPEGRSACDGGRTMNALFTYIFGRYISTPPIDRIIDQGYAVVTAYPPEFVPDNSEGGLQALAELAAGYQDEETRWGAIAAWGWGFSRMIDALEEDSRFDARAMITYGHSRYGKAALVAGAFDLRVDGVVTHQSGTGGAALNRDKPGESVGDITTTYPHWFSKVYAGYAGREEALPIDQHALLALLAPRPIFLGNARRDVWSDPSGSFLAARGADQAYELLGSRGLEQESLKEFIPSADISFFTRPGTHGVTEEDWPAFLQFLNAHFKPAGDEVIASRQEDR